MKNTKIFTITDNCKFIGIEPFIYKPGSIIDIYRERYTGGTDHTHAVIIGVLRDEAYPVSDSIDGFNDDGIHEVYNAVLIGGTDKPSLTALWLDEIKIKKGA